MTEQEIIEGNMLIAFFMDAESYKHEDSTLRFSGKFVPEEYCKTHAKSCLHFHNNWNWLMPVVEKIESIYDDFHGYFGVHIYSNGCTIQGTKLNTSIENPHYAYFADYYADTKLEATWQAVVHWIQWWNQKQQNEMGKNTETS